MHYLIEKAFKELYPERSIDFDAKLKYSSSFKGYNANVKYTAGYKEFRLSSKWKEVSDEIKIGLIQHLLNKMHNTRIKTINIELYDIFLKKLPATAPKTRTEPILEDSFSRMNMGYFDGQLMQPNLVFAGKNFTTLGSYSYMDDTIKISSALKKDLHLLDYVMYHEMLHKKLKYYETEKKRIHHSTEFRRLEREFQDTGAEEKLKEFIRREKLGFFRWF